MATEDNYEDVNDESNGGMNNHNDDNGDNGNGGGTGTGNGHGMSGQGDGMKDHNGDDDDNGDNGNGGGTGTGNGHGMSGQGDGMKGHDDEGIMPTLVLQSLPEFNAEEDFVILSKEIFTALESDEGDGFSVEEEFAVAEEDSADTTGAVFVFAADGQGGGSLIYDTNGTEAGFGDDGGEILDIAQITGNADELTVDDFFIVV